ncbi:sensor histidine kinase [Anaeromyxobacter paludicola]|uniref:histidine kinase n=1 Tax=Anaeromyxobacter paludicola TaxID=2918171 RepID=A0ABM7X672_9BACT|nr:ATP-binding protein [Anaeromyxobacter paludicola]BDG07305.1 hypothetical protein AMPC_04180 [Anaeromyxobacter paludicola]
MGERRRWEGPGRWYLPVLGAVYLAAGACVVALVNPREPSAGRPALALLAVLALLFAAQTVVGRRLLLSREHLERAVAERTRELESARAQLAVSDRLATVGTMAAGVAHEINNPLTYVLANVAFLADQLARPEQDPALRAELASAAQEAREGADRVRSVVLGLRAFAHAPSGDLQPVAIGPEIEAAVAMCRHHIEQRGRFEVRVADDLPAVRGRPHELGQVFVNLLVNAGQALAEDARQRNRVILEARPAPGGVAVEVRDNGAGIAPESLPRLFDPFFTTKPVGQGTGLGLSICHGIVHRSGGRIEVESAPGQGALFRVTLPLAAPARRTA